MRFGQLLFCTLLLAHTALAQMPLQGARGLDGRRVPYRPYLGRVVVYQEFFGAVYNLSLNAEYSPLMTENTTLNIRLGATNHRNNVSEPPRGYSLIYGLGAEFGRRMGRFQIGAGGSFYDRTGGSFGVFKPIWFGSVGYKFQTPSGFFLDWRFTFLLLTMTTPPLDIARIGQKTLILAPSTTMGYRIPSVQKHRSYKAYGKLTKTEEGLTAEISSL